jgi:hypothetical protein
MCYNTDCRIIIMLSVVVLSAVMLTVVAPIKQIGVLVEQV